MHRVGGGFAVRAGVSARLAAAGVCAGSVHGSDGAVLDEAVAKAGGKDLVDVVEPTACASPGFAGKVHALHVGSQTDSARQAEVLLFVDVDTVLDPRLTRAAIALVAERGLGMLSLHSSLTHDTWFEWLVQPPGGYGTAAAVSAGVGECDGGAWCGRLRMGSSFC